MSTVPERRHSEADILPSCISSNRVSPPTLSLLELSLNDSSPRIMKIDLSTLPQFNVTYIARCLTVCERLSILTCVHHRLRKFILQPQCFPDMSFCPSVPDEDDADNSSDHDNNYHPKILSANSSYGITYVEINIFSQHPFVVRVALLAGMWNFKCDSWNDIPWPNKVNIESLQLTLDYSSNSGIVHLDHPPHYKLLKLIKKSTPKRQKKQNNFQISTTSISSRETPQTPQKELAEDDIVSEEINFADCISPTTQKPMVFKSRLRNLFFIRFDSTGRQPEIIFPSTLWGLGLQSFTTSIFAQDWWLRQVQIEQRFESLRFLVLSCCDFSNNELQTLLKYTANIEHLSMRYVRWEGTVYFPKSLLSLGYFPDRQSEGYYSFKNVNNLWQISTRLNDNPDASIAFLNECRKLQSIRRVKFELVRREEYNEDNFDLNKCEKWDNGDNYQKSQKTGENNKNNKNNKNNTNNKNNKKSHQICEENDNEDREKKINELLEIVISEDDLNQFPILKEIFPVKEENFIRIEQTDFSDCPYWSDESKEFIHMTRKRKLLLR